MSYQVLARKWRPKTFAELSGQEHVVKALANALDKGRLHHAYLLTGTRGVGKTTIARLIAKSLNCVKGVTSAPCGVCDACMAIDAGRFVDLLELDAASNTGVDNMREILDNARYAPTVGRYKVYLIDEVHMLSKGAFNSMLKTLEEPPEHVKFVLATTDPQKVPITVLSRCLQFNLKPLPASKIEARLAHILDAEGIAHDAPALALLARAARGSLRDALSLLDQAIAFGAGEVRDEAGARDARQRRPRSPVPDPRCRARRRRRRAAGRGRRAGRARPCRGRGARGAGVAAAPDRRRPGRAGGRRRVRRRASACAAFASRMSPEATQLAWQIAIQGRDDLDLAPETATGFAMTLLRMLAFAPAADDAPAPRAGGGSARGTTSAARAPVVPGPRLRGRRRRAASASPPAVTPAMAFVATGAVDGACGRDAIEHVRSAATVVLLRHQRP